MKKNMYLFALLLAAALAACTAENDEPEQPTTRQDEMPADSSNCSQDTTLAPVMPSEEVASFFSKNLYKQMMVSIEDGKDTCFVIGSYDELSAIYSGSDELPRIDFGENMLVVGKVSLPYGYKADCHDLEVSGQTSILHITYNWPLGTGAVEISSDMPYWGLYPKRNVQNLNMQLAQEKDYSMIAEFFKNNLPMQGYPAPSTAFFLERNADKGASDDEYCIVINTREELAAAYHGSDPLPEIDFSTTTLILGYAFCGNGYKFRAINVENKEQESVITLLLKERKGEVFTADMIRYYFWALSPKFSPKGVITFKHELDSANR